MAGVTALQALVDHVAAGGALGEADAAVLLASPDLLAAGMMADEVRRRLHGTRATFVRVLELHVDAVPAAWPSSAAAGEIRIAGTPSSAESALAAIAAARGLDPGVPLTAFSLPDAARLEAASPGILARLRRAGLDGVAEAPVDDPDTTAAGIAAARGAGLRVERMTVGALLADPVALLARARDLQRAAGGFRAFAPLPRDVRAALPTTGYADVRLVALARLMIAEVPSIQVDWPRYGPKLAQVALTMGADDVDGVAAVDAGGLGARRSALEEIRGNIRAAGFQPVERDGRYGLEPR